MEDESNRNDIIQPFRHYYYVAVLLTERQWVVSGWLLNATPAQLGYTVPFTSVYAGKYRTGDKSKTNTLHKLNTIQKKQTTQNTAEHTIRYDRRV